MVSVTDTIGRDSVCTDAGLESASEHSEAPTAAARPSGLSGVSPKHLAVDPQPLPYSSSSEELDNNSDDQVATVDMG